MGLPRTQRNVIQGANVILLLAVISVPALSQDTHLTDQTAPPPLKVITRQERTQLNEAKDAKARLKLTLELAEAHLANAENRTSQREFDNAAAEVGMYWALVEDLFRFLKTIQRDNDRTRDLYKRLELSLRVHGPRLSLMRRSTPAEYAVWIKEIEESARKGRTEALNSFYGHTVVRDGPQKPADQKEAEKPLPES